MAKSSSVSVRLQRITKEVAYVSVPLTRDVLQSDAGDRTSQHIDTEKLMRAATKLGRDNQTKWSLDGEVVIAPHPLKVAPE
jgi:hypothetical protein